MRALYGWVARGLFFFTVFVFLTFGIHLLVS